MNLLLIGTYILEENKRTKKVNKTRSVRKLNGDNKIKCIVMSNDNKRRNKRAITIRGMVARCNNTSYNYGPIYDSMSMT